MVSLIWLFVCGFVGVFALGFQSRAVNHDNFWLAAGNSMFIGFTQTNIWWIIDANRGWLAALVYAVSGSLGITTSMLVHRRWFTKKKPQ